MGQLGSNVCSKCFELSKRALDSENREIRAHRQVFYNRGALSENGGSLGLQWLKILGRGCDPGYCGGGGPRGAHSISQSGADEGPPLQ